jgi:DeoR/GlpR family transcriptional regulator of sugar metabolism
MSVGDLAKVLQVSMATIRRDLTYLANEGRIIRTHGGALLVPDLPLTYDPSLDSKSMLMIQEKRAIGVVGAALVQPGESVALDPGSTTWQVAQYLKTRQPLTIVSNDLIILHDLARVPGLKVIDTGGIKKQSVS